MAAVVDQPEGRFAEAILRAIGQEAAKIVEEESAKAAEEAQRRVRELVPQVVMAISKQYSYERRGDSVVITVREAR